MPTRRSSMVPRPVTRPPAGPTCTSTGRAIGGLVGFAPENTLPGFELALDLGVDTLELDVHFTADDQVVVWHDPIIDPTKCEGEGVGRRVRDLEALALRSLRCASNPDASTFSDQTADPGVVAGDDYGIVTLSDLFGFVEEYSRSADKTPEQRMGGGDGAVQCGNKTAARRSGGDRRRIRRPGHGFVRAGHRRGRRRGRGGGADHRAELRPSIAVVDRRRTS